MSSKSVVNAEEEPEFIPKRMLTRLCCSCLFPFPSISLPPERFAPNNPPSLPLAFSISPCQAFSTYTRRILFTSGRRNAPSLFPLFAIKMRMVGKKNKGRETQREREREREREGGGSQSLNMSGGKAMFFEFVLP